jgi:hypothetical protein
VRRKLRRIWPFEDWELEQQQAWLADMASQGWHLSGLRPLATFVKGDPARMRYRVDISDSEDAEQIALYEAAGWEYVGRRLNVQIFRAPTDASIPEIYTDEVEQAATLRLLNRNLWASLLFPAIYLTTLAIGLFYSHQLIVAVVLKFGWMHLLGAALLTYSAVQSLRGLLHITRLRSRLLRGQGLGSTPYQRLLGRRSAIIPAFILLGTLFIGLSLYGRFAGGNSRFPPIPSAELPMARLSDLLQQAGYQQFRHSDQAAWLYERAGGDVLNYYRKQSSLLVPVQEELREKMEVVGYPEHSAFSPMMSTARYVAQAPAIARLLAEGMAARKPDVFQLGQLSPATLEGVDGFWLRSEDNVHGFILLKGNVVVDVYYQGLEPLEQVLGLHLERSLDVTGY